MAASATAAQPSAASGEFAVDTTGPLCDPPAALSRPEGAGPPPPLPPLSVLGDPVTIAAAGDRYFMWDALEVARLRTRGHLAITAIGSCAMKTSTRGKAAALPVMLSDEEACVLLEAGWARMVDALGSPVADANARLAAEVAGDPTGVRSLRRLAFRDMWLRGYCLTNGVKFGCDYLCYRDDPTAVHAAFMVVVLREGSGVRTLSLTAVARVATTALKIAVVAWVDPHARTVRYAAFKRMGPGSAIFQDARAAGSEGEAAAAAAAAAGAAGAAASSSSSSSAAAAASSSAVAMAEEGGGAETGVT
jgi:tRNA-intron lyase